MSSRRLPLADTRALAGLARRTRAQWVVLALALVALLTVFVLVAGSGSPRSDLLPTGGSTVVVIDLSGSTRDASRRIANALLGMTRNTDRKLGLVVFSDTGYEALPLATPATALRSWLMLLADGRTSIYPWTPSFSGGTVISSGLTVASRMLQTRPVASRHVLLVSDLVDGIVDLPKLQSMVAQYQRDRIDLRVITLRDATKAGQQSNASFLELPNAGFVAQAASHAIDSTSLAPQHRSSGWLIALVALVAVLAAAYELVLHPLTWRRA